jgi:hypothetical protein
MHPAKGRKKTILSPHSLSVTTVTLGSRLFFILLQINLLTEKYEKRGPAGLQVYWEK